MNIDTITMKKTVVRATLPICLSALIVLLTCTGTGTGPGYEERNAIVIEAYLFAGQPVNHIRLKNLNKAVHDTMISLPVWNSHNNRLDTIDTLVQWVSDSSNTIDNALVMISNGSVTQTLAFRDSGWYRDTSGKLTIAVGKTYRIDVFADSRHAWAETTVPSIISGLRVSRDTIITDTVTPVDPCGKYGCKDPDTSGGTTSIRLLPENLANLNVTWSNPNHYYLYYRCYFDPNSNFTDYFGTFTNNDSLKITGQRDTGNINQADISYGGSNGDIRLLVPGTYKFVLYATTPDFRKMIETNADSTREDKWIKAPNQINDGLGVFTAFSISDSVFFTVVQTPGGS